MSESRLGALIIFITAGMWGLFWIPLRYIEQSGFPGLWSVSLVFATGIVFSVPIYLYRSGAARSVDIPTLLIGFGMGLAGVLYFSALIFTDVIRAVFLFYLLPFWAILTARIFYGVAIHWIQLFAGCFAILGLYLLLGGDGSIPLPTNMGDWLALGSGFWWGLSLTMLRGNPKTDPADVITFTFIFGVLVSLLMLFSFPSALGLRDISFSNLSLVTLLLSLALGGLFIMPSIYGQAWGARFVSSATAAILTMSEILFATVSYWLFGYSELGFVSIVGGLIIVFSGILGLLYGEDTVEESSIERG